MLIELDGDSDDAPYEQIRIQIGALVATGALVPGDRLPSIRQLAGDLGVATGTVARAYRELEADGVAQSRGARGTTISGDSHGDELLPAAFDLASIATRSHLSIDDALLAVRIAFAARRGQA